MPQPEPVSYNLFEPLDPFESLSKREVPEGYRWNTPFPQIFREHYGPGWQPAHGLIADTILHHVYPGGREGMRLDLRDDVARREAMGKGLLHIPLISENVGTRKGAEEQIIHDPEIRSRHLKEWLGESKVLRGNNPDYRGDEPHMPELLFHSTGTRRDRSERGLPVFDTFDIAKGRHLGQHFGSVSAAQDAAFTGVVDRHSVEPSVEYDEEGYPIVSAISPTPEVLAEGGVSMGPFVLRLENPLHLPDLGEWHPADVLHELVMQRVITQEEARDFMPLLPYPMSSVEANQALRDLIESKGYDGIEYWNRQELRKDIRGEDVKSTDGEDTLEKSYIIFHPWQVKHATMNRGYYRIDRDSFMSRVGRKKTGLFGEDSETV